MSTFTCILCGQERQVDYRNDRITGVCEKCRPPESVADLTPDERKRLGRVAGIAAWLMEAVHLKA
ncbi:MAG: hypothetical protein WC356_01640 [Candidatus Micrarchaeia archaeon]|jgi:hypothetical protein